MNVTREADDAYCKEKGIRSLSDMENGARAEVSPAKQKRLFDQQQNRWDKLAAKRAQKTGILPTGWLWCAYEFCKLPFRPERKATVHCSPRCKRHGERSETAVA
jgi:hypothetical protein